MDKFIFLGQSFKELITTGSLFPSSRFLARRMIAESNIAKARLVVEFGGGTGAITSEILKVLPVNGRLVVFEVNPKLARFLRESVRDSRLSIVEDDAVRVEHHLKSRSLGKADSVISGLPLANFPKNKSCEILKAASASLSSGGAFVQFQYSLSSRKLIKKIFNDMRISFEYRNLPPAFVYSCRKLSA